MQTNEVKKEPLLEVKHLKKYFPLQTNIFGKPKFYLRAVDDVTFSLEPGKTIGVVGESGCGKTTLGRTILQLYELTGGKAIYYGQTIDDFLPKYYLHSIKVLPQYKTKYEALLTTCEELKNAYNALCSEVSSENVDKPVLDSNKLSFTISSLDGITTISNELKKLLVIDKSIELKDLDKQKLTCLKALIKALNKMHQALEYISSTTGGFVFSDNILEVKKNLLTKLLNEKKLKKLEKSKFKYNTKIEILKEQKADEDKIEKYNVKLENIENQINEANTLAKEASKNLGNLKGEIETTDLFNSLEKNREKGLDLSRLSKGDLRLLRTEIQLIFQDPYSSLPPRMTVGSIISEAVKVHNIVPKEKVKEHVRDIMKKCGLQPQYYDRYPHEFSGGQRQRICIARALAVNPKLVICDEPVSALDVSIQAQIINLLKDLQRDLGLTYIFISHDLSVVKYITDNILVMYLGNMMEIGDTKDIFKNPLHPYTQALFSAVPIPNPDAKMNRIILKGDIPSPANPPKGCKFHTRCEKCMGVCKLLAPKFIKKEENHYVACHLYDEEVMAKLEEYDKEVERLEQEEAEKERLKNEQQKQKDYLQSIKVLPQYKTKYEELSEDCEELKNTYNALCNEVVSKNEETALSSNEDKPALDSNELSFTISSLDEIKTISNELKKLLVIDKEIKLTYLDKRKFTCLNALVKNLNEMHQVLEYISSTTGGFVFSDNILEVKENLLTKLLNEKKLKELEKSKIKYNTKIELLIKQKVDEDKIKKYKVKIENIENQINEANILVKEANKNLDSLKSEIEVTDLFNSLELALEKQPTKANLKN